MLDKIINDIQYKTEELNSHSLYNEIYSLTDLRFFMERHCFAVLDFMSLTKRLQQEFSPIDQFWTPPKDKEMSRFINEIVLAEESDKDQNGSCMSHFEMYCNAMKEVNAETYPIQSFVSQLSRVKDPFQIMDKVYIPQSARDFTMGTYLLISENQIHKTVAAFCFGREKLIPQIFLSLLENMNIDRATAPTFYYYLERHIQIDSDEHGPLAEKMLSNVCGTDSTKWTEAKDAALRSIELRINFWSDIHKELLNLRSGNTQLLNC